MTTQHKEVYEFLWNRFMEECCGDERDAMEMMIAWKRLEGFIACHGLGDLG